MSLWTDNSSKSAMVYFYFLDTDVSTEPLAWHSLLCLGVEELPTSFLLCLSPPTLLFPTNRADVTNLIAVLGVELRSLTEKNLVQQRLEQWPDVLQLSSNCQVGWLKPLLSPLLLPSTIFFASLLHSTWQLQGHIQENRVWEGNSVEELFIRFWVVFDFPDHESKPSAGEFGTLWPDLMVRGSHALWHTASSQVQGIAYQWGSWAAWEFLTLWYYMSDDDVIQEMNR